MSDEEKFAAQGRVYAELRQARGTAATITESLLKSAQELEEMGRRLQRFLTDPRDSGGALDLQERLGRTSTERIASLIGELDTETQKVTLLQQRVDKF